MVGLLSEYPEGVKTEHKVPSKATKGREVSGDTDVGK